MLGMNEKLANLKEPIKVGLVGAGYMGSGLLNVITQMHSMEVVGLYDKDNILAKQIGAAYGTSETKVYDNIEEMCAESKSEIIVDATPSPVIGAETIQACLNHKKHLVSINIECDVTVGAIANQLFKNAGLIYTVTAGDEPGELKKLYDHYSALNFRVIALGKGKNNPLRVDATPDAVKDSLPNNGITAQQAASFVDGSKTMFEMACVSNATGLPPDIRGMHGQEAKTAELPEIFTLKKNGGILNQEGVVDYVTGTELSGGIFIVVTTANERIKSDFKYLKIGNGPSYAFYQRYHNWFIDTPLSVAKVILDKEPTIVSLASSTSQVIAVAKKNLKKGEVMDGIGGFCVYGVIERNDTARKNNLLPHSLTENAVLKKDVPKGEELTLSDVKFDEMSTLFKLYKCVINR